MVSGGGGASQQGAAPVNSQQTNAPRSVSSSNKKK